MLYKFKLGCNATEVAKNTCYVKGWGVVNHSKVTRWFKKFYLVPDGSRNFI